MGYLMGYPPESSNLASWKIPEMEVYSLENYQTKWRIFQQATSHDRIVRNTCSRG